MKIQLHETRGGSNSPNIIIKNIREESDKEKDKKTVVVMLGSVMMFSKANILMKCQPRGCCVDAIGLLCGVYEFKYSCQLEIILSLCSSPKDQNDRSINYLDKLRMFVCIVYFI